MEKPKRIIHIEKFIGKNKPFVILTVFILVMGACYFSPWLDENSVSFAVCDRNTAKYEQLSDIYLADKSAIEFSMFWGYTKEPFGCKAFLHYVVTYDNGTTFEWCDYYFVDPLFNANYLYNITL